MGRGPVDTSFLVSVPLVSLRAWASPRYQMHREGHRVFLEGWQAISAEDCEVFAGFLWPCGTTFLRPSSYHNLCHGCVWICFEIVEAFVCQRHTGAPQKRWQCGPLACLQGVTRGQVPFQAWQIQSRHMFGTVKVGSAWASRRNGSARRSQTGSFAGLCPFPSTPSQQSVSAFEWEASKMPATLWWVAFKTWFFASSLGCWDSKTSAGARQWQGRVVHHDVTGALPMAGVWLPPLRTRFLPQNSTAESVFRFYLEPGWHEFRQAIQSTHLPGARMSMAMLTGAVWERWWWKELADANDSRMSCDQRWGWSRLLSRWPKIQAAIAKRSFGWVRMEAFPASAFTIINPCFCKKVGHMLHKHVVTKRFISTWDIPYPCPWESVDIAPHMAFRVKIIPARDPKQCARETCLTSRSPDLWHELRSLDLLNYI